MDESDPDEHDDEDPAEPGPSPAPGPLTADRVSALIRKVIA